MIEVDPNEPTERKEGREELPNHATCDGENSLALQQVLASGLRELRLQLYNNIIE